MARNCLTYSGTEGTTDYTGTYTILQYQLTYTLTGDHGTIPALDGWYDINSIVTLTATPDQRYRIKAWHGTNNDDSKETSNTVTMTTDKEVIVEFEEIPPDILNATQVKIKASKSREWPLDSITISGLSFNAVSSDFANTNSIFIDLFNSDQESPVFFDEIKVSSGKLKNGKFGYKGSVDGVTLLIFDIYKDTFSITAKDIDLSGLRSPIIARIEIGDYLATCTMYDGETLGSGEMIDVINGKKPIPMHLLSGYANSLCVDKCNFKLGTKKPRTDSLTIQGTFAVEDTSVDIASKDIVISWGDVYNITLPKETMFQVKDDIFKYKKPMGSDLSIAAAIFNLKKCTFKIVINKAEIAWQGNPVEFRIQFDDFNETSIIQLRENKNYWFFP